MTPTKLDSSQIQKVAKAALYIALSAGISALIAAIASNPVLFGALTPFINILLVFLKQVFTTPEA